MHPHELILDPFTYLSYKSTWKDIDPKTEPAWTGEHARRLQAYRILEHYFRNASRHFVSGDVSDADKAARREYGDASLLVNQVMASVLGQGGMRIHVEGAELTPNNSVPTPQEGGQPTLPPDGTLPPPDDTLPPPDPATQPVPGAGDIVEEESAPDAQLRVLRDWMEKERFYTKQIEHERNIGKLGDGVLVLGWSSKKNRPVLTVYDPGFYFPVYDGDGADEEGNTEDYPRKVHIAYEYEDETEPFGKRRKIRRITWELDEYEPDETGAIPTNDLPWNEKPTTLTCWMSDGWWYASSDTDMTRLKDEDAHWRSYYDDELGEWVEFKDIDLGIDFIPVVHFTNTVAGEEIWGTSTIASVLQILDDLISSDTDLQAASATTGTPPLSVKGTAVGTEKIQGYGPGTVFQSENGLDMVDTSNSLTALTNYVKHLLERLSINSRVPESMLGRVKPSEVPSGIALWLSFAPHSTMINEMRMVRQEKYALLFKFVTRYYMLAGELDAFYPVSVSFGSYLPADRAEVLNMVTQGLNATTPPFSLQTAIKMLMDAGWPIESIATELANIQARDFAGASELVGVTGNPADGAAYLGIQLQPMVEPIDEEDTDPFGGGGNGLLEPEEGTGTGNENILF